VTLPWRSGSGPRPAGLPVPPARMASWNRRRPLKRWRYVGFYGEAVQLCAATARIGPFPLSWWAVWDREARRLEEATHRAPRPYTGAGFVRVDEGPVRIDLRFEDGPGVETVSPHGASYIWTRKQAPAMRGTVAVAGRVHEVAGHGIVDDSAGYHARRTAWRWSAGVGVLESGAPVAWNLVDGVHDAPSASERTVWVAGEPREVGPVHFAGDLSRVTFTSGEALEFTAESVRAHAENLLLVASSYEQPFGTFTGALPGSGRLARGHGVMERHDVRW
jgi:hypothetical protein